MRPVITIGSLHPARISDRQFFIAHPWRRFRARPYVAGETPEFLFVTSEDNTIHLANCVVIKRIPHGRWSQYFFYPKLKCLGTDQKIRDFLERRGVNPETFRKKTSS